MEKWQSDLIVEVTDEFSSVNRDRDRRVLEHLAAHSSPTGRDKRTKRYLKDTFFKNWDGNIPSYIAQLDERLHRYFDSEKGRHHDQIFELLHGTDVAPADKYAVRFVSNWRALVRSFWKPYLIAGRPTFIVYGVPLFIRSADQKVFTRHADWNIESDCDLAETPGDFCWPFVTHGDIQAAMDLNNWLVLHGPKPVFVHMKASSTLPDLTAGRPPDSNVIAVGSARVNSILAGYQTRGLHGVSVHSSRNLPWRLETFAVVQRDDDGRQVGPALEDEKGKDATQVPVVITRRYGVLRDESFVTLIASNHGRAVEQVAMILTNDHEINKLFSDQRLQHWREKLPEQFQIVLRVEILEGEQLGGEFSVLDTWSCQ